MDQREVCTDMATGGVTGRGQPFRAVGRRLTRISREVLRRGLQGERTTRGIVLGGGTDISDEVELAGDNDIGRYAFLAGKVTVGHGTTIGVQSVVVGPATIGDFCQIGPGVHVFAENHPLERFSTYTGKRLLGRALRPHMSTEEVVVGHGVWIGCRAVVLGGVHVGNGAVVAAGALVTRDVPPYAVVAGNPARPVRDRFEPDVAELIDRTRWWELRGEEQEILRPLVDLDMVAEPERARHVLAEVIEASTARRRASPGGDRDDRRESPNESRPLPEGDHQELTAPPGQAVGSRPDQELTAPPG